MSATTSKLRQHPTDEPGGAARHRRRNVLARRRRAADVARHAVLYAIVLIAVFPVLWIMLTSVRTQRDIISGGFVPDAVTMDNFNQAIQKYDFGSYVVNSLVVTIVTVAVVMLLAVPASYALARFRLPGKPLIILVLLLVRMIPVIALAIPLFDIFSQLGLLDTWWALIIAQTAAKIPVAVWLIMGFMESVPHDIEESARLDGAGLLTTLVRIVTPLVSPGIASAAVLTFIFTWNDLLVALTLTSSPNAQTLPVGLTNFVGLYGIEWGPMAAAGVLMIIPTILFVWLAQRRLVDGLVAGAVK